MAGATQQEIKAAVDRAWTIPGLYRKGEAAFLYELARRSGNIVEIGCWMGRSTAILVQAAKVWGAQVMSVDIFSPMPHDYPRSSRGKWTAKLESIGLVPPELLEMASEEAAKVYDREIALLFIDGDHNQEVVAQDLADWGAKVKVGGVIALHDMFYPSITGVAKAVTTWWEMQRVGTIPNWELVGMVDFTIAFRRLR